MSEPARHARHDITADALFEMPNDDLRRELVRGEIRTMRPTGGLHGVMVARITAALWQHVESSRMTVCSSTTACRSQGRDDVQVDLMTLLPFDP